jgi:hypothetical protein
MVREGTFSKLSDAVIKYSGISFTDKIGKETFINTAIRNATRLAEANDAKFTKKVDALFGKESQSFLNDLKNNVKSQNVLYYAFNELSDFQPISLSEVPEYYLRGGNWRLAYMLKTFGLKQLSVFRREAFDKIANKATAAEGFANLFKLTMLYLMLNVPIDIIKDLLKGREVNVADSVVDSLLKIFLLGKYQANKMSRDGVIRTLIAWGIPPVNLADRFLKDAYNVLTGNIYGIEDIQTTRSIPWLGEFIYSTLNK